MKRTNKLIALSAIALAALPIAQAHAQADTHASSQADPENGASQNHSPSARPAVINFVDMGGIRNWRAVDNETLLVEGRNNQWFKATMFGPCPGLPFASAIGFITDFSNSLDRFSSIYVDGQRCTFRTFEKIDPPAP